MKTIKPTKISLVWKTFELHNKVYLSIVLMVMVDLDEAPSFYSEVDLWKLAGEELGKDMMLDECMPKQKGEVLANGRCFTPKGAPLQGSSVRIKIGSVDKTLYVFGDRVWEWHGAMSLPEPFTEMPIAWAHAFGGDGEPKNPLGRGMPSKTGGPNRLPNVEDPKHLIKSRGDRPTPASFDAVDLQWPQRWSKIGSYDMAWVEKYAPGFAPDIDLSMFNTAPDDQQIEGFWKGDEAFSIENMHPSIARIEGRLPNIKTRCFITRKKEGGEELEELTTQLDTVRFIPHRERVVVAFRALTNVVEDDAADILDVLAACEDPGDPRPLEHYKAVREKRLEKRRGALHSLRDSDLVPTRMLGKKKGEPLDPRSAEALSQSEGLLRRNMVERARLHAEQTRQEIRDAGGNPDDYKIPEPPADEAPPDLEEIPAAVDRAEAMAEEQKKELERQREEAKLKARVAYAELGLDYDQAVEDAERDSKGPPKFSAEKEIERLSEIRQMAQNGGVDTPELDAALADPELRPRLERVERELKDAYRKYAHYLTAAAKLEGEARESVRERVAKAYASGESFVDHDLTGADLSGLDLSVGNFQGAFLEGADLSGCKLTQADFSGAVLARANLRGADLSKANLSGTNLGDASLVDAKLGEGATLEGAILTKADLSGAVLTRAKMHKADLMEAKFAGADMRGADLTETLFLRNDLSGARFGEADLSHAIFVEVTLTAADFTSAKLTGTTMVTVNGDKMVLVNASFDNARIVHGSSLEGADLRGVLASRTNFRDTKMTGADLSGATANNADFSGADLTSAKLYRITGKEAMFARTNLSGADLTGANLFGAILQKAKLAGAVFKGANLFRADLFRAEGDARTSMERANVKNVRSLQRRG